MSFSGMRIFHVIPMYHQQGMPFPNMISVQSLCFNSIEQRGNYYCSMLRTFRYDLLMVNLIHKCLCRRKKVNGALLVRFSNSILPDYSASKISTNHLCNDISSAVPTIHVVPRGRFFLIVKYNNVDGFVRFLYSWT